MIIIYRQCPICGKLFKANTHGRPRKYCSDDCKWEDIKTKRKKERIIEQKCQYCGKTFDGNKKQIYCSQECAKKANQDNMKAINSYLWHNDPTYRSRQQFKYGDANGTIKIQKNEEHDWEKELKILKALKKRAGLK